MRYIAPVRLISLVSRSGKTLGEILDGLPKVFNTPETRFEVDETRKFAVIDEVKQRLAQISGLKVNDIDGVRVTNVRWLVAGPRLEYAERTGRPRRSVDRSQAGRA